MLIWTGVLIAVSTVTFVAGLFLIPALVVRIPSDYFAREKPPRLPFEQRHPLLRWALLASKNLVGVALVIAGIVMLFTPGPGIISVLVGMTLTDLPGKRALERRLIALPKVLEAINRLRARRGKPPLLPPLRQFV